MTLAIKFGDSNDPNSVSGVVYFDAVTKYDKIYGGKTAKHPIEAGAHITDHYYSENPQYRIQGVVSEVDFSPIPTLTAFDGEAPLNASTPPSPVTVGGGSGSWRSLIPDVVSQFLGIDYPSVDGDRVERVNFSIPIEDYFKEILHGLYFNEERGKLENRATLVTLFEMGGNSVIPERTIENLVVTGFKVSEDEETGTALFFDMQLEEIRFATSEQADAPAPNTAESRGTQGTKDIGNVPAEKQNPDSDVPILTASGQAEKAKDNVKEVAQ